MTAEHCSAAAVAPIFVHHRRMVEFRPSRPSYGIGAWPGRTVAQEINTAIGTQARQWVGQEVGTWDDCANRFTRLYQELLKGRAQ